ncbi:MAG: DotU family type IV/VI secretion system protein [Deltaproteobacteria bacterium]|jgi:hypothetical protein|nr:DotU family type IV/VI secretion system protein [Deltaproteobacteria bacterium]
MHFVNRYFKIFHYALTVVAEPATPDWSQVAAALSQVFKEEEERPLPAGFNELTRRECLAPILIWIDERFLTSGRSDALAWYNHSLQLQRLETNQGGEIFYRRLKELLARRLNELDPAAVSQLPQGVAGAPLTKLWVKPGLGPEPWESVLDAYALCLLLGYRGRFHSDQPKGFQLLKDLAIEQITAWGLKDPRSTESGRATWQWPSRLWEFCCDFGWPAFHLALPSAICLYLWFYSRKIVESLPF